MSELVPHYAQCFLTLGIALERYLLVCHPAWARQSFNGAKKLIFYLVFTAAALLPSGLVVTETVHFILEPLQQKCNILYPQQ